MTTAITGTDVSIPARGIAPAQTGYAALPEGAKRGVVVVHEIFGRAPDIDEVVDRFGRAGYAAVEPNLFTGAPHVVCIAKAMKAIQTGKGEGVERIFAARDWLCEQAKLPPERVGVIGFCIGGGFALAVGPGFAAVSTNYGDIPPTEVLRGLPPTIGCYGTRDVLFRKNKGVLEERAAAVGATVETHMIQDAGHAFLTHGDHPIAAALLRPLMHIDWRPDLAEQAWEKIMAFFDRTLPKE